MCGDQPRSQGLSSSLPWSGREEERPWERGWCGDMVFLSGGKPDEALY